MRPLLLALMIPVLLPLQEGGGAPVEAPPTAGWHRDPDCRLVFFATLEGLYGDGVPNEVVDLVLGEPSKASDGVKRCFVFRCELCHAVYDAFALYRRRPAFHGGDRDTFGDWKPDPDLLKRLRSEEAQVRVFAMGALVQPWIRRKLLTLKLDAAAAEAMVQRLGDLVARGRKLTHEHREKDPAYAQWQFYGACQACEAIDTASRILQEDAKPLP